ncbi:MAG: hypothetical protein MI919_29060, partial [Holophagales bacterium]|nr:hypothetical protein [Holophagales bacterium]
MQLPDYRFPKFSASAGNVPMLSRAALVGALLAASAPAPVSGQEVRIYPADVVYAYDNLGEGTPSTMSTAVLQHVAVINTSNEPLTVKGLTVRFARGDHHLGTVEVAAATLAESAARYAALREAGVLARYEFQFHTSQYLDEGVTFPGSTTLPPGAALVVDRIPLLFSQPPDELRVTSRLASSDGSVSEASSAIEVARYQSRNDFHFPVVGRWFVAAGPSLHSHHRWAVQQEFALDLVQIGPDTSTFRATGSALNHYHAYGARVVAAADG